jgi:hypothetical protein
MEAHQKPLVFEPLGISEIRLVRFTKDSKTPDQVQLQLERFKMENVPSFVALSYVWGDQKDLHAVSINNRSFSVTKNLFLALTHIYDLLPKKASEKHQILVKTSYSCGSMQFVSTRRMLTKSLSRFQK